MKNKSYQRKKYILKDSSQVGLIIKTYALLLTIIVISGTVFYVAGNRQLTNEYYQAHSAINSTMELLIPSLIAVNTLGLIAAFILIVYYTHSIVGPIYRLKSLSGRIKEGDLSFRLKFRSSDSLKELAAVINEILEHLNKQVRGLKRPIDEISRLSKDIKNIENLSEDERKMLKKELISVVKTLEDNIDHFQL